MDNKSYTSTEEFPFPAMEPDKDEMFINIRNRNYAALKKEIVTLELFLLINVSEWYLG